MGRRLTKETMIERLVQKIWHSSAEEDFEAIEADIDADDVFQNNEITSDDDFTPPVIEDALASESYEYIKALYDREIAGTKYESEIKNEHLKKALRAAKTKELNSVLLILKAIIYENFGYTGDRNSKLEIHRKIQMCCSDYHKKFGQEQKPSNQIINKIIRDAINLKTH